MRFTASILSEPGGRPYNEDRCGYVACGGSHCWVLADGLGGHGSGEVAAALAVEAILSDFQTSAEISTSRMLACLSSGHAAVVAGQNGNGAHSQMYTTAVVLMAAQGFACWGHVGDSRLYYFHRGRVARRTLDHSVPQTLVSAGQLRDREIRLHADRNRLLRTLGSRQELRPAVDQQDGIEPGDAFLMASDGFWEYVLETEMEIELARSASADLWIAGMSLRLAARAPFDRDNSSAIAVLVE
jgi:serine/threonine protein phosphatase PrpC